MIIIIHYFQIFSKGRPSAGAGFQGSLHNIDHGINMRYFESSEFVTKFSSISCILYFSYVK